MISLESILHTGKKAILAGAAALAFAAAGCGSWDNTSPTNPPPSPSPNPTATPDPTPSPTPNPPIYYRAPSDVLEGLDISFFRDGQDPNQGIFPTIEQVRSDLDRAAQLTSSARFYGCDEKTPLGQVPAECDKRGINCYEGGWISSDSAANAATVRQLIKFSGENHPFLKGFVVGNEVRLRNDIPSDEQSSLIKEVNDATDIPVTTAEPWNVWLANPSLADSVDYIMIHVHPYWEGVSVDNAPDYVIQRWNEVRQAFPGKKVVIGETGWPTRGAANGQAVPSEENQRKFIVEFDKLARANGADYFIFDAFDEKWKEQYGGQVEGSWGLWNAGRTRKRSLEGILDELAAKIAFGESMEVDDNNPDLYTTNIWLVNTDGSNPKKLWTLTGQYNDSKIRFSPDGNQVAFGAGDSSILISDLKGNILHTIPTYNDFRASWDFTWTPDGSSLIYGGYYNPGVYRYNLATKTTDTLHQDSEFVYEHNLAVSPDGSKIANIRHSWGSQYQLFLMGANGENRTEITRGDGTSYDEDMRLGWIDNENLVFKISPNQRLYRANISTMQVAEIIPGVSFMNDGISPSIWLSPDKSALAINDWESLYIADAKGLRGSALKPALICNSFSDSTGVRYFAWSKDARYFSTAEWNFSSADYPDTDKPIRMFDKIGREYNVPVRFPRWSIFGNDTLDIDISPKPIGPLGTFTR